MHPSADQDAELRLEVTDPTAPVLLGPVGRFGLCVAENCSLTSPPSVNVGYNRKAARIGGAAESCPQGRKDNNA